MVKYHSKTLRVDADIFKYREKKYPFSKIPGCVWMRLRRRAFRRNRISVKTLSKVDPNENAYASSSWKRYEIDSFHTKTLSVFGITENEANRKRISVEIAKELDITWGCFKRTNM